VVWPGHQSLTTLALVLSLVWAGLAGCPAVPVWLTVTACAAVSGFLGVSFAIRIGGADMPITISLLNSLSGTAIASAGMSVGDPLLISVGGVVGSAGLLLTQSMCHAMNRSLTDILMGRTSVGAAIPAVPPAEAAPGGPPEAAGPDVPAPPADLGALLRSARRVIIIPGYGMALAQAQTQVKELADKLEAGGATVDFAIHPVAGRMPGHMNVLLAEVAVPYEKLREMDEINPDFADCDLAVVVGANDVINPAAHTAEGTPIYGMPVLAAEAARHVIICNLDLKPGYAGVDNPLYKSPKATLLLGDAAETVGSLVEKL
jgi:NAD(P) transhydrogenase subunit beta